ncbi:MAG: hypothetical protein E7656_10715 [Ruminococcaceae bacterium]|nr:hypothetical protein [Oscillospiraceae bacterium]
MRSGAKKHITAAIAFILVGITLVCGTAIATSARRTETIDVTYDNIQIVLDGKTIDPKDALGNKVEPFIYNGTTYLPVRAVGEAFGKEVSWDGATKTVYIGAKPGEHESWLVQCPPYSSENMYMYPYNGIDSFKMSGKEYTNAFTMRGWGAESGGSGFCIFNLDGKYNSVTFTAGHVDDTRNENTVLTVYVDDAVAYKEEVKWDEPAKKITIPLNGALRMKMVITKESGWESYCGFADGYFE